MSYATLDDIRRIYGAEFLSDITPVDVASPELAMAQALEDASAEIDAYLSAKYDLPLQSEPRVLRKPCVDIGIFNITNTHGRLTKTIEDRYDRAVKLLKLMAEGKAGLGRDEPKSTVPGSTSGASSGADFSARERVFGRDRS